MLDIRMETYSGPMDLLLDLVRQAKIDIYDIEISAITEEYLQAIREIRVSPEELSDFIRMASLLVAMKAKSLVSELEDPEEEIPSNEELVNRLLAYEKMRTMLPLLKKREGLGYDYKRRLPEDLGAFAKEAVVIVHDADVLRTTMWNLLRRQITVANQEDLSEVVAGEEYVLAEIREKIRDYLKEEKVFSFQDLFDIPSISRAFLIAHFLSLLELSKNEEVRLTQKRNRVILVERRKDRGDESAG